MQVNLAIPLLLELLLEECWDIPGTLEVLLCHVPHSNLRSVLSEIADSGWVTSLIRCQNTLDRELAQHYVLSSSGAEASMSRMTSTCLLSLR